MQNGKWFDSVLVRQACCMLLLAGLAGLLILPEIAATTAGEFKLADGTNPAAASDGSTFSVVVWESDDGDGTGISALRLDELGLPAGIEFQVNPSATGTQRNPDVTVLANGEFVVVWENIDNQGTRILGQRFTDTGLPAGIEFSVQPSGESLEPAIGADGDGNFVVAWTGSPQQAPNGKYRHFVRRFDSLGNPLEAPQALGKKGPASPPALAVRNNGKYLVAWESQNKDIRAIVLDEFSSPVTHLLRVNDPGGRHKQPAVAVVGDDFVISWNKTIGQTSSIQLRSIIDTGLPAGIEFLPAGIEFQVNLSAVDEGSQPALATDDENAVVSWQSKADALGRNSVLTRMIDRGLPAGIEFQVNPITNGLAGQADITVEAPNSFLVVWENQGSPTAASTDLDILANCIEVH